VSQILIKSIFNGKSHCSRTRQNIVAYPRKLGDELIELCSSSGTPFTA